MTLGNGSARFFIKGDSTLNIPAFAQIGHAPDLAVVSAGKANLTATEPATPLYVENLDEHMLGAAGSFLAKMAYASREVTSVAVTAGWPMERKGGLLAFGTFSGLSGMARSDLGIDLNPVATDLALPVDATPAEGTSTAEAAAPALSLDGTIPQQDAAPSASLVSRLKGGAESLLDHAKTRVRIQAAQLGLVDDPAVLSEDSVYQVTGQADMLLAQRLVNDQDAWTMVAVRDPATLDESMRSLAQADVWGRLGGAVHTLAKDGTTIERKEAAREQLYETRPLSLQNGRLVVAGWFSNNAREFTIAQIAVAILLGASTYVVLRRGRKP